MGEKNKKCLRFMCLCYNGVMKKVLCLFITAFCCILAAQSVNALTYQHEVRVQFTFNDVLSLTVDDESIDLGTLLPGQNTTSDPVTLTVNTNYLYGYKLLATVGDENHDYRDLRRTDGQHSFTSLAVGSDVATLPASDSVWGYAKSTDSGTTWSNYSGLPKYDDTTNSVALNMSNGAAANDITKFRVGANVKNTQAPGTYSNVVNFILVTNPGKTYIQDITSTQCSAEGTTVYDRRDETEYTIMRVGDNCWLMNSLRLDLVATSLEQLQGNTNASDTTLNYLKNGGGRNTPTYMTTHFYGTGAVTKWTSKNYSVPMFYDGVADQTPGEITGKSEQGYVGPVGFYYNFCAASAGSFCMGSGTDYGMWTTPNYPIITEDICPSGWRLPTAAEYSAIFTTYQYSSDAEDALHLPRAGEYIDSLSTASGIRNYGYYWSSTMSTSRDMKAIRGNKSGWNVDSGVRRDYGTPVRCVLNES